MHEFSEQIYEVMGWSLDAEFLPDLTTPEGFAELQKAEEWLEKKLTCWKDTDNRTAWIKVALRDSTLD